MSPRNPRTGSDSGSRQKVSNGQWSHEKFTPFLSPTFYMWLCLLVKGTCLDAAISHHPALSSRGPLSWEAFLDFSCPFYVTLCSHVYAFWLQPSLLCLSALLDSELFQVSDGVRFLPMVWQTSRMNGEETEIASKSHCKTENVIPAGLVHIEAFYPSSCYSQCLA